MVEPDAPVRWGREPGTAISRATRVVALAEGALSLIVARSRVGNVGDAGVTLGVGDPAICVGWFPECGCDACDSGSQDELDDFDRHILGIISGALRRLSDAPRTITVVARGGWRAPGHFRRHEVEAILADPTGWADLVGPSWLDPT